VTTCSVAACSGGALLRFSPGSDGNVAPVFTLSGGNTHLVGPTGIVLHYDSTGNGHIVVADPGAGRVSIWPLNPAGPGVAPDTYLLTGTMTQLTDPVAVAVDEGGRLFVSDNHNNVIYEYPASVFAKNDCFD
jgi:hypothetical protein